MRRKKKTKETVDQFLKEGIKITRDISFELTPPVLKEFGLKTAVEEIITRYKNPKLHISCKLKGPEDSLDYTAALSVYRIIQELLNNVIKHAGATSAGVELIVREKEVVLRVWDNGKGMLAEDLQKKKGIGLKSVQNRVNLLEGKLSIGTVAEKGCSVEIVFNRYHLNKAI